MGMAFAAAGRGQQDASETPPAYLGRAFLFEADLELGAELGWLDAAMTPEEALEAIEESLEQRLRRTGKFVEGVVSREEGGRFAVTFVGKQSSGFEALLIEGMSAAGRFSFHVAATDSDLTACGSSLALEIERLEDWLGADPTRHPSRFSNLERAAGGGPCPGIAWLPRRQGGGERAARAVGVRREPSYLFRAIQIELLKVVPLADRELPVLEVTLAADGLEALRAFRQEAGEADLLFAVDGQVVVNQILKEPIENPVRLDGGFDVSELRPLILAFAGEPLPAPLRFLSREQRELPNVKLRDSPTAID